MENKMRTFFIMFCLVLAIGSFIWSMVWMGLAFDLGKQVRRDKLIIASQEETIKEYEYWTDYNESWFNNYVELSQTCGANE